VLSPSGHCGRIRLVCPRTCVIIPPADTRQRNSLDQSCPDTPKNEFVLVLGSLHLTLMAALGLWLWSSPQRYETFQAVRLGLSLDKLPLRCTNTTIFGSSIPLTSVALNRFSLIFYSIFLVPGLNLAIPASFFLSLFIWGGKLSYHTMHSNSTSGSFDSKEEYSSYNAPSVAIQTPVNDETLPHAFFTRRTGPILCGLLFLLAVNIVFISDIETTIRRAEPYQDAGDESKWTFGQTLAIFLLILPVRDVYDYIRDTLEPKDAKIQGGQLTRDANIDVVNNEGRTPLGTAREMGNEAVVGLLEDTVAQRESRIEAERSSRPAPTDASEDSKQVVTS
jgi:hypothetical protein